MTAATAPTESPVPTAPTASEDLRRAVLLLNNPFVGDSRSWKLACSLAGNGWAVTVVARSADGLPGREEHNGFDVVRIHQPRPLAWLPTPRLPEAATGEATGEATRRRRSGLAGLRAAATEIVGRPIQAIRYLRLAEQWADRIARVVPGAEIWQAEGMITLPVALDLRRRLGGRVVYDARDLQVESSRFAQLPGPWRRLLARRERGWARSADATLTVNRPYAEVIERSLGVRPTIVFNGPTGVGEAQPVPIRERLGLEPTTRIVLCLGSVAPGRGVEQLCRAIVEVPDAVLLVVGPGGAFRERLRLEASRLPAGDRIHFLPEVAPADIPAWTAAADVAAMPIQPTTLNHRLTTPTRLFDALGAGVPIVASDLPGMAEIVRQTGAGVVCDPSDPAAIGAALREVLDAPPGRRAELRAAALAAANGTYAWDRQVDTLLGVYRDVESA
jgi:glycosyltransferase involved in cell wall biosynthesis